MIYEVFKEPLNKLVDVMLVSYNIRLVISPSKNDRF